MERPTRVHVIWKALVVAQDYRDSPTMASFAWDTAERIATAIRVAERRYPKRRPMNDIDIRSRYTAKYDYPGMLFPEEIVKDIANGSLEAALDAAPDGDPADRWFGARDGWYAVTITKIVEKCFTARDGEESWVRQGEPVKVANYVFGEAVHADDIEETDRTRILIANIRGNSREPLKDVGVHTRAGNWQIASDYTQVIPAPVPAFP